MAIAIRKYPIEHFTFIYSFTEYIAFVLSHGKHHEIRIFEFERDSSRHENTNKVSFSHFDWYRLFVSHFGSQRDSHSHCLSNCVSHCVRNSFQHRFSFSHHVRNSHGSSSGALVRKPFFHCRNHQIWNCPCFKFHHFFRFLWKWSCRSLGTMRTFCHYLLHQTLSLRRNRNSLWSSPK